MSTTKEETLLLYQTLFPVDSLVRVSKPFGVSLPVVFTEILLHSSVCVHFMTFLIKWRSKVSEHSIFGEKFLSSNIRKKIFHVDDHK